MNMILVGCSAHDFDVSLCVCCCLCVPHRRLKLYPTGLGLSHDNGWVSLFLVHDDSSWMPPNLTPKATFKLTVINQTGAAADFSKGGPSGLFDEILHDGTLTGTTSWLVAPP